MGMKVTGSSVLKAVLYTAIALVFLGVLKTSMPDVWAKIPGLKEF